MSINTPHLDDSSLDENSAQLRLTKLIVNDSLRMHALRCLREVFPQGYIAAGFVRNCVWDDLHGIHTNLTDIDVIYFDDCKQFNSDEIEHELYQRDPALPWQVKDQATMHRVNQDRPYTSLIDAMAHWPEKETAVAIKLNHSNQIEYLSAFGIARLFSLILTHNPARHQQVFLARVTSKQWLQRWPLLQIPSV